MISSRSAAVGRSGRRPSSASIGRSQRRNVSAIKQLGRILPRSGHDGGAFLSQGQNPRIEVSVKPGPGHKSCVSSCRLGRRRAGRSLPGPCLKHQPTWFAAPPAAPRPRDELVGIHGPSACVFGALVDVAQHLDAAAHHLDELSARQALLRQPQRLGLQFLAASRALAQGVRARQPQVAPVSAARLTPPTASASLRGRASRTGDVLVAQGPAVRLAATERRVVALARLPADDVHETGRPRGSASASAGRR
jgi:hypothetical protein